MKIYKFLAPVAVFLVIAFVAYRNGDWQAAIYLSCIALLIALAVYFFYNKVDKKVYNDTTTIKGVVACSEKFHTYYGDTLNFSDWEIISILKKRFPYFNSLTPPQRNKFITRTQFFIGNKIFKIHGEETYKEMPVLISAAAVQLTFGLNKFLLPYFKYINIYPEEFLKTHPTLRILIGNVSGNTINLSWKHFLHGYEDHTDGQNVGLHELAHAFYYQTFVIEKNVNQKFKNTFNHFNEHGNKAFEQESILATTLYSEYALRNFQEFWAESIELFFEKPAAMKVTYPQLYNAMQSLLNQDPFNKIISVIS